MSENQNIVDDGAGQTDAASVAALLASTLKTSGLPEPELPEIDQSNRGAHTGNDDRAACGPGDQQAADPSPIGGASIITNVFFDPHRSHYLVPDSRQNWIPLNEPSVRRVLENEGVCTEKPKDGGLSEMQQILLHIQTARNVDYSGPLAGHRKGLHHLQGRHVLVTDEAKLITPHAGQYPLIQSFMRGLLDDPQHDQCSHFFGWLNTALETLYAGGIRPGQCLALAGPKDCGKSLLQTLITEMLGGRAASPYRYMSGQTTFNSELFGAEHLVIEDEIPTTDIRSRRALGAQIKSMTVNVQQSCHAKNRIAVPLRPFWRISISVNDEPEFMMILPPLDESLADKIILLKCAKKPMAMPTCTLEQREAFWKALVAELPAFLYWLLNEWEIPQALRSERFGIAHFHHPQLVQALDALAPEIRLLDLIDLTLFGEESLECLDGEDWEGTAMELERRLVGSRSDCAYEARRLFTYNSACGVYLGRLRDKHPDRFSERVVHGARIWTIKSPSRPPLGASNNTQRRQRQRSDWA